MPSETVKEGLEPRPIESLWTKNRGPSPESVPHLLLNAGQMAKLLGCSVRHVYRLSGTGRMPSPLHLGALVRWNREAVKQWIENGCPGGRETRVR